MTPDYAPVVTSNLAWICSGLLLLVTAAGLARLLRERRYWWEKWLKTRVWGWLLLLTVAFVTCGVMVSQRPRPSYMLAAGILLRAAAAMSSFVLVARSRYRQWLNLAYPVLALASILNVPAYYAMVNPSGQQPLRVAYERLAEFQSLLERPGRALVTPGYGDELCNYAGHGNCTGLEYYSLRAEVTPERNWLKVLDAHSAAFVYVDEAVLGGPAGRELVSELSSRWKRLPSRREDAGLWMLFANPERTALPVLPAPKPGR